ncbi:MAG: sigma-54 dependent transcriptional regulator [Bacteroidota bacterium]
MIPTSAIKIFVVEDDPWYSEWLTYHLGLNPDFEVIRFTSAKACIKMLHEHPQVITLDYSLPDMKGEEALKKIRKESPGTDVIVISAQEKIDTAVNLLKQGAYDYIVKDNDTRDRLLNTIEHIRNKQALNLELDKLRSEVTSKYDFQKAIIGNSDSMKQVFNMMEKAARSQITVSISGETGTGKELIAKAIHYQSPRNKKSFMAVNVASIPRDLLESELFGHEKGSFTGAVSRRLGKFEEAQGGTIFLDEIADLDFGLQAKILRVLQEREISRIGSNTLISLDVRIIVATHKNLADEVKKGTFREDLYYRLLGLPIHLPPLRERGNDILLIAKHFLDHFCIENKIPAKTFSTDAQKKLTSYYYPGNARELKAIVELAAVITDEVIITEQQIVFGNAASLDDLLQNETTMEEYNRRILKHYMNKYDQNVLLIADKLQIGKSTIYRMLKDGRI